MTRLFRIAAAPASTQGEQRPSQDLPSTPHPQQSATRAVKAHQRAHEGNNARTREENAHTRVDNNATRATIDEPSTPKGTRSKIKHTHARNNLQDNSRLIEKCFGN